MDRNWRSIILLWLTGVLAAAQLAKLSALVPLLQARFGMALPETGLLVSLLEVGGALFGFVAGLLLPWIGAHRALVSGMGLLTLATCVEAFTPDVRVLFVARAVEGMGYLLVVIAAPTMIVSAAQNGVTRTGALALWSTFVPVGMALGSGLTGLATTAFGFRPALLLWAGLIALGMAAVVPFKVTPAEPSHLAVPPVAAWLLTAGFGCYTLCLCALTALLPSFFAAQYGASIEVASLITAGVSLAAVPGTGIALKTAHSGTPSSCRIMIVAAVALLVGAVLAPFVYRANGLASSGALAALTAVLSGIARTLLFTRVPVLSGATGADPRVAAANGLLTQFGAGGALLGPPLGGLAVEHFGWTGLGLLVSTLMLAMLGLLITAEWNGSRQRSVWSLSG